MIPFIGIFEVDCYMFNIRIVYLQFYQVSESGNCRRGDGGGRPGNGETVGFPG